MKAIQLACLVSIFSIGVAQAAVPCDEFQIVVNNQLADNLLATKVQIKGASLDPDGIQKLDSKQSLVFTVKKSQADVPMKGELTFHTISLPSKSVAIQFSLNNSGLICKHDDQPQSSDYSVEKTRLPNKVEYTISNK